MVIEADATELINTKDTQLQSLIQQSCISQCLLPFSYLS